MTDRAKPGSPPGRVQSGPFVVRCPPGRYALCQCERSATFPYCDGTHRNSAEGASTDRPLKINIDEERTVAFCCCRRSAEPPFCDGSHTGR